MTKIAELQYLEDLLKHPGYQILMERAELMAIDSSERLVHLDPHDADKIRDAQYKVWRYRELKNIHATVLTELYETIAEMEQREGQGLAPENTAASDRLEID